MPVFIAQVLTTLGGVAVTMLGQLATEAFIKTMVVRALDLVVQKTATQADNDLLKAACQAWGIDAPSDLSK